MKYIQVLLLLTLWSCSAPYKQKVDQPEFPDSFLGIQEAVGGYALWNQQEAMSFQLRNERHLVNLKSRKVFIEKDSIPFIGFDGQDVWVTDSTRLANARFYHNLYFYFLTIPHVLSDPGVLYTSVGERELQGKTYAGLQIDFMNGVGDASEDNYIVWYDPLTYQMDWLMYTVTYRSGVSSSDYRLIKYQDWEEINGLRFATTLQWYDLDSAGVGEAKNKAEFKNLKLREVAYSDSLFKKPANAMVAPR